MLDKPAGLCVIPARNGDPDDCLRHVIERRLGANVFVVHRIDRETSGVVIMARTAEAHRILNDAFAAREVRKEYRALVEGAPRDDAGVIDVALAPARKGRMRPAQAGEEGRASRTDYRVLERYPASGERPGPASLLAFEPRTGRQHQIRVHARWLGCPILGDRLYAPQVVCERAPRLMLHAHGLRLRHPDDGSEIEFVAPLPADFALVRQRLATL